MTISIRRIKEHFNRGPLGKVKKYGTRSRKSKLPRGGLPQIPGWRVMAAGRHARGWIGTYRKRARAVEDRLLHRMRRDHANARERKNPVYEQPSIVKRIWRAMAGAK